MLACALVLADPLAAEAAAAGVSSAARDVPVGLTALGAVLGLTAFGARQWWSREGRTRRP